MGSPSGHLTTPHTIIPHHTSPHSTPRHSTTSHATPQHNTLAYTKEPTGLLGCASILRGTALHITSHDGTAPHATARHTSYAGSPSQWVSRMRRIIRTYGTARQPTARNITPLHNTPQHTHHHRSPTMNLTKAVVTLHSTSPYSQSRKHDTEKLEGESANAHEERTWKERMHVRTFNKGKPTERQGVVIPASGMNQAIAAAAKFLNKKIEGQRNSTWTKHFVAGISVMSDIDLKLDPNDCRRQTINAHANGVRGSGTRVTRFFPTFDEWEATFEVMVLDPLITEAIFTEVIEAAGLFVGVGQHRPEQLGTNGRWEIDNIDWQDSRKTKPMKKAA